MSDRRMFSKRIVESSRFLKLPDNVQNLYFHLMMNTDDDGIVEAFTVLRICGATMEDLEQLEAAGLVCRLNDDLVAYMEDWREQNTLRADRKKDSIYLDLLRRKRPDVQVLEKKARSDSKTRKEDDSQGQTMDGPWTAQDKISQSNIIESKVMKDQSIFQSAEREKERSIKNTQTFNEHLKKYCEEAGIDPKGHGSHSIRFTVASILYLNGTPIQEIQRLLGHTSMAMTLHYLKDVQPRHKTAELMEKCL